MALTVSQRVSRYRARKRSIRIVSVTVLVPTGARADLRMLAEALCVEPELRPGPLRNPRSGRLVSAKTVLSRRAAL